MAVFLIGVFIVGRPAGGVPVGLFAHIMLEEPDRASYLASAHHSDNNSVQVTSFDWTNGSHSLTTAPPVSRTNRLIQ